MESYQWVFILIGVLFGLVGFFYLRMKKIKSKLGKTPTLMGIGNVAEEGLNLMGYTFLTLGAVIALFGLLAPVILNYFGFI